LGVIATLGIATLSGFAAVYTEMVSRSALHRGLWQPEPAVGALLGGDGGLLWMWSG